MMKMKLYFFVKVARKEEIDRRGLLIHWTVPKTKKIHLLETNILLK